MAEKSWVLKFLHGASGAPWASDPQSFDPDALKKSIAKFNLLYGKRGRYFRTSIEGLERVPDAPSLVVSNHSGGTTIPDVYGFGLLWYEHFGIERPIHLLAHEVVVGLEGLGRWFAARGVLRAGHDTARAVFEQGRDLMVMPGGDLDTWRPYKDRYRIQFGGHVGYARLAIKHEVPIVPVVNAGAHETLMVLTDGQRFAKAIGLHRLARADVWPIHLSIPWGLGFGPLPHIPLPAKIRYRVGKPIWPEEFERERDPVRALDEAVRGSMQRMLDGLRP